MKKKIDFLILIFFVFSFSGCAQENIHSKIIGTTKKVINYLNNCDTAGILNLLDVSFAHTDKINFRTFISGSILKDCHLFQTIIKAHGLPDPVKLSFKKDSGVMIAANIAELPLITKADSALNMKRCFLVLCFYPDDLFAGNSNLLRYSIVYEELKKVDREDKVELPQWLKDIDQKNGKKTNKPSL